MQGCASSRHNRYGSKSVVVSLLNSHIRPNLFYIGVIVKSVLMSNDL